MAHESITLWGYRTGGLETPAGIRNGFAFDLRQVDLRHRTVRSAALHLRGAARCGGARVELMDPSEASTYGSLDQLQVRSDTVRIPLSTTALADLADAAGSFFSVTAVVRDNAGLTQRLVSRRLRHCLVLTLAESAGLAAA